MVDSLSSLMNTNTNTNTNKNKKKGNSNSIKTVGKELKQWRNVVKGLLKKMESRKACHLTIILFIR